MAHHTPTPGTDVIDDGVPPAMDYKMHEATYKAFITFVKWTVGVLSVTLVALYFIINP